MVTDEQVLAGGNAAEFVVRSGDTVRKPWAASTENVHHFLHTLRSAGVDAPKAAGPDKKGRQVIEYVAGTSAIDRGQLNVEELLKVGSIVRAIHDNSPVCTATDIKSWKVLIPASEPDLICHNDLAPWNFIIGNRWVFIDWDGAGPSTRLWDLAYAAQSFAGLWEGEQPEEAGVRLRAFIDGYGADHVQRAALPEMLARRVSAMHDVLRSASVTGHQPWARMYADGHGAHWRATREYVARHIETWRTALTS